VYSDTDPAIVYGGHQHRATAGTAHIVYPAQYSAYGINVFTHVTADHYEFSAVAHVGW